MRLWAALLLLSAAAGKPCAQESEEVQAAKQTENPIANIVNLQLNNSTGYLIGPNERSQDVLTLQPVVPVSLSRRLTVIGQARIPLAWQPDVTSPTGDTFGLGDITLNLYFGLKPKSILFWGVGPALRFPTATDKGLGPLDSGMFSLGPAAAVVVTPGRFVVGLFVSNVWSVAGRDDGSTVNQLTLQPIFDYNLPSGWYLTSSPSILCDWTVPDNKGWLVPVGAGLGNVRLFRSKIAVGFEAQAFWNVVRPVFGPLWALRLQISLAFPKILGAPPRP